MAESIRTTSPTWSGSSPKASPGCERPARYSLDIVAAKCWTGGEIRVSTTLEIWVEEAAKLPTPERVVYCDVSEAEYQCMIAKMLSAGDTCTLNEKPSP